MFYMHTLSTLLQGVKVWCSGTGEMLYSSLIKNNLPRQKKNSTKSFI